MCRYNKNRGNLLLITIACLLISTKAGIFGDNLILKPLSDKTGEESAIIFIIGASCSQDSYVDVLTQIQEKVDFPLWIGIPHIIADMAIPPGLGFYIDNVKSEMKSKGMKATKIFYGGHSLGGASISRWMSSNPDEVEGGFLWGSYVSSSIKDPAKNYPVPLLTVGAQYDGWLARITRIARSYDQMKSSELGYDQSKYRYPVVVLPGMDHASFLNGTVPQTVRDTDLRATVSTSTAIQQVSDVVSSFITFTKEGKDSQNGQSATKIMDHYIDDVTGPMVDPILEMWALEGNPSLSSFKNKSPWIEETQRYIAGDLKDEFEFVDEYKTFTAISGEFSHAKPSIEKDGDSLKVLSYSHSAYNWRTADLIDAADFYAAYEIGGKFKSRAALYSYLNRTMAEKEPTCQEINQFTYNWVLQNWNGSKSVIDEYLSVGEPMEFLEDYNSVSGITFVNEGMTYTNTTTNMQVQSRHLLSSVDFIVPKAAGMLYCKVMSPARVLEWVMVDGLKMNRFWQQDIIIENTNENYLQSQFLSFQDH